MGNIRYESVRKKFEALKMSKPTDTPTNQRLVPIICGQAELPIPTGQKILFGPVDKPVRRESTNLAVALKSMTNTEA